MRLNSTFLPFCSITAELNLYSYTYCACVLLFYFIIVSGWMCRLTPLNESRVFDHDYHVKQFACYDKDNF